MDDLRHPPASAASNVRLSRRKALTIGTSATAALALRSVVAQTETPASTPSAASTPTANSDPTATAFPTETPELIVDPIAAFGAYAQELAKLGHSAFEGVAIFSSFEQAVEHRFLTADILPSLPTTLNWFGASRFVLDNPDNPSGSGVDTDYTLFLIGHVNEDDAKASKTAFNTLYLSSAGTVDRTADIKPMVKGVNAFQLDSTWSNGTAWSYGAAVYRAENLLAVLAQNAYGVPIDLEVTARLMEAIQETLPGNGSILPIGPRLLLDPSGVPTAVGISAFGGTDIPYLNDAEGDLERRAAFNDAVAVAAQNQLLFSDDAAGTTFVYLNDVRTFADADVAQTWWDEFAGKPIDSLWQYADSADSGQNLLDETEIPGLELEQAVARAGFYSYQDGLLPFGEVGIQSGTLIQILKVIEFGDTLPPDTSAESMTETYEQLVDRAAREIYARELAEDVILGSWLVAAPQ